VQAPSEGMWMRLAADGYAFGSPVEVIVMSPQFQNKGAGRFAGIIVCSSFSSRRLPRQAKYELLTPWEESNERDLLVRGWSMG
jgi:hypothetical protein